MSWHWTRWGSNGAGWGASGGDVWSGTYAELELTTAANGVERTVDEGGSFKWNALCAWWIRSAAHDVADSNAGEINRIDGDVVPSSETVAWNHTATNGGVITQATDRVTIDSVNGTSTARAAVDYVPGTSLVPAGSGIYWVARIEVLSVSATDDDQSRMFEMGTSTKSMRLNLHHADTSVRIINTSNATTDTQNTAVDLTVAETLLEGYLDSTADARVFAGAAAGAALEQTWADLATSDTDWTIGDTAAVPSDAHIEMTIRDLKIFRLN